MTRTKHMVLMALMVSQALVLSIAESWISVPFGIPGVKLGLANIITLIIIMFFGLKDAVAVVTVRCLLAAMFAGGFALLPFSLTGGLLSSVVMYIIFKKYGMVFGTIGISIAGAVTHNLGQLSIAALLMHDFSVFAYLPVLLLSGIVTGSFVGLCVHFLSSVLKKNIWW